MLTSAGTVMTVLAIDQVLPGVNLVADAAQATPVSPPPFMAGFALGSDWFGSTPPSTAEELARIVVPAENELVPHDVEFAGVVLSESAIGGVARRLQIA